MLSFPFLLSRGWTLDFKASLPSQSLPKWFLQHFWAQWGNTHCLLQPIRLKWLSRSVYQREYRLLKPWPVFKQISFFPCKEARTTFIFSQFTCWKHLLKMWLLTDRKILLCLCVWGDKREWWDSVHSGPEMFKDRRFQSKEEGWEAAVASY